MHRPICPCGRQGLRHSHCDTRTHHRPLHPPLPALTTLLDTSGRLDAGWLSVEVGSVFNRGRGLPVHNLLGGWCAIHSARWRARAVGCGGGWSCQRPQGPPLGRTSEAHSPPEPPRVANLTHDLLQATGTAGPAFFFDAGAGAGAQGARAPAGGTSCALSPLLQHLCPPPPRHRPPAVGRCCPA